MTWYDGNAFLNSSASVKLVYLVENLDFRNEANGELLKGKIILWVRTHMENLMARCDVNCMLDVYNSSTMDPNLEKDTLFYRQLHFEIIACTVPKSP